ncbi:MAG TPA: hypothetical protein VNK82_10205 [Terriglobales bacterium]|nr:hypothetical protein [Terriglobales bacterium]
MARKLVAKTGRGILTGWWVLVCLAGTAAAQRGAITLPRNLDELTRRSAVIVRGRVASARVEKHPQLTNLNTIVVTLHVTQTLKGKAGSRYTFRQYIWDFRDRQDAAGYRKGQELLLLMNPVSQYGLTSPAGMEQGRFRIFRDRSGREVAVNGFGNHGLFRDLETQLVKKGVKLSPRMASLVRQQPRGPIAVADLRDLILELQRTRGQ